MSCFLNTNRKVRKDLRNEHELSELCVILCVLCGKIHFSKIQLK